MISLIGTGEDKKAGWWSGRRRRFTIKCLKYEYIKKQIIECDKR